MSFWQGIVGKGFTAAEFAEYLCSIRLIHWQPKFVVLHNTAAPKLSQWHSVPGADRMLNLQHFYRDIQNWNAGPHVFVANDLIWVFTPLDRPGVHSPSWNEQSWGVEIVGDYDIEDFAGPIKANAIAALSALHRFGGLDPNSLRLHHEDPQTTHHNCPGNGVDKAEMIAAITGSLSAESRG